MGVGGGWGVPPTHVHTHTHARTCMHTHARVVNMIISCKCPPPLGEYLGIPYDVIRACEFWCFGLLAALGRGKVGGWGVWQHGRVSPHMCTCMHMHAHACMHSHTFKKLQMAINMFIMIVVSSPSSLSSPCHPHHPHVIPVIPTSSLSSPHHPKTPI